MAAATATLSGRGKLRASAYRHKVAGAGVEGVDWCDGSSSFARHHGVHYFRTCLAQDIMSPGSVGQAVQTLNPEPSLYGLKWVGFLWYVLVCNLLGWGWVDNTLDL